jgi:hypothetical protein
MRWDPLIVGRGFWPRRVTLRPIFFHQNGFSAVLARLIAPGSRLVGFGPGSVAPDCRTPGTDAAFPGAGHGNLPPSGATALAGHRGDARLPPVLTVPGLTPCGIASGISRWILPAQWTISLPCGSAARRCTASFPGPAASAASCGPLSRRNRVICMTRCWPHGRIAPWRRWTAAAC